MNNETPCAVYPEQDAGEISLCSLSSCAVRRRGSPPARWQVLGKGRALAPGTPTCSQNRINTAHYPSRSSVLVCALLYPNRIIIIMHAWPISEELFEKRREEEKSERKRERERDGETERERERERGGGENKKKEKNSKERENRPACLAAQLPHDFDLRNR